MRSPSSPSLELSTELALDKESIERSLVRARQRLCNLITERAVEPKEVFEEKEEEEEAKEEALKKALYSMIANSNSDKMEDSLPPVEELFSMLLNYYELSDKLHKADIQFIDLSKNLFYNHPVTNVVKIACDRKSECVKEAAFQIQSVYNGPINPTLKQEITRNREMMAENHILLFDLSRALAHYALLFDQIYYSVKSEKIPSASSQSLFFSLLKNIYYNYLPANSPISEKFIRITLDLGTKLIKPPDQRKLISNILTFSAPVTNNSFSTLSKPNINSPEEDYIVSRRYLSNRQLLLSLFDPLEFVPEQIIEYLELLKIVCTTSHRLTRSEEFQVFNSFDIEKVVDLILKKKKEEEVTMLLELTPYLLRSEETTQFGGILLKKMIAFELKASLNSLFAVSKQKLDSRAIITSWDIDWFSEIKWNEIQVEKIREISNLLVSHLPFTSSFTNSSLVKFVSMLLSVENFSKEILRSAVEDNQEGETFWNDFISLVNAILLPFTEGRGKAKDIAQILKLMVKLCEPVEDARLLNQIWKFYDNHFFKKVVSYRVHDKDILTHSLLKFNWNVADFHLKNNSNYSKFRFYLLKHDEFATDLFKRLDWRELDKYIDKQGVLDFLFFFLDANLLQQEHLLMPRDPKAEEAQKYLMAQKVEFIQKLTDWTQVDEQALQRIFKANNVLIELILSANFDSDPTERLVENVHVLKTAVNSTGKLSLQSAFIRQVKALLFFSTVNHKGSYWSVPYDTQVSLVTHVLVPPIRSFVPENEHSTKMVFDLISCVTDTWKEPVHIGASSLGSSPTFAGSETVKVKEMQSKILGVVTQALGTSSPEACLEALSVAPKCIVSPMELYPLLDIILRAFFTQTKVNNPLAEACGALHLPAVHIHHCMACVSSQTALTLLVVLEKQRREHQYLPTIDWISQFALPTLVYILGFSPNANSILDIFTLWLFALKVVADSRWPSLESLKLTPQEVKCADILQQLRWLLQSFLPQTGILSGVFGSSIAPAKILELKNFMTSRLKIGAAACALYLERICLEKLQNADKHKKDILSSHKKQLLSLKKLKENKGCEESLLKNFLQKGAWRRI